MITLIGAISIPLWALLTFAPVKSMGMLLPDGTALLSPDTFGELRLKSPTHHGGTRCLRETASQPWRCGNLMDYGINYDQDRKGKI